MKISVILFVAFVFSLHQVKSQNSTISGVVKDKITGEVLVGVNIYSELLGKGVVTDNEGNYSMVLKKGFHNLKYSYLGYKGAEIHREVFEDIIVNVDLEPSTIQTEEVIIADKRSYENVIKTVDNIQISKEEIKKLPYLLGEVDPIKMLQLLPGVQSNGEGNNGIFVRGGGIDQNLILLDQAPVYNTGHLFGFFSLFNYSILDNVNLIKGGIPASHGGRLSSVLEVTTRNGNFDEYKGEGQLGIVSGNLMLEGPISKGKSSFVICGRRTYIDLLSKLVTKDQTIFNSGINYFFDDINGRVDFKLSPVDRISISGYTGSDNFHFQGKNSLSNKINWTNYTSSISWDHFLSDKNFITTSVFGSNYQLDFSAGINEYVFNIHSSIKDYGFKNIFTIGSVSNHHITFGTEYIHHSLVPNNIKANGLDFDFSFPEQEELKSQEQAIFINDEFEISSALAVSAGLRFSGYQQLGPYTFYTTDESLSLIDTLTYSKNKIIKNYWNLDPRLSINFRLNESSSIKASFDRMHQYLHMAPISSVSLPTDVWVPSSERIKPQKGDQLSMGFFKNFRKDHFETSLTAYYKLMKNQMEYRDGVVVGYSKGFNYDDSFIFGKGVSYGFETFIKKNNGKVTGWISYTLSSTTRKFAEINQGRSFAAKYDRLHNLSVVTNYSSGPRWSFSGVFSYATGNALTLPVGRYTIGGNIINEYEGRNTFRMPAYHRMDISATYSLQKKSKYESFWIFSVYNVYNRKNPYYIYIETKGNVNAYSLDVSLEKVSLFPIIPSVAYQIKF